MKRALPVYLAVFLAAAFGPAPGSAPGQGLFSPASHLWVTASPGFEPIIRTYRLDDLDGDGYAEYPIHGGTNTSNPAPGWVRIMDGRSGLVRQEWVGSPQPTNCFFPVPTGEFFGKHGAAHDLNGDGLRQEVALGSWNSITYCASLPLQIGRAELRSFPQGAPLLSVTPADSGNFGVPVENVGDVDGNGTEEVLIGAPSWNGNAGKVRILSGMGLTEIYSYTGWQNGQLFGNVAAGGGTSTATALPTSSSEPSTRTTLQRAPTTQGRPGSTPVRRAR